MPSVLVARFEGRTEIASIVRAAIDLEIAYVALAEAPPSGRHTLHLFLGEVLVASLGAELVGSGRGGAYPLRLRLLDPAHGIAPRAEPDDKTLASQGAADENLFEDRTLASRASPPVRVRTTEEPVVGEGEVVGRTVFAPDSVLRARLPPPAPSKRASHGDDVFTDDESQTLPGSSTRTPGGAAVSWNMRIAPTTKDPLCGRTIGGKYVLDSVIGTGAIGIVFKASHRDLGRTVAIKVLNPRYRDDVELLEVFRAEARAASQLEHPNVARVYDYGQEPEGLVYIVMEYLSGYTLGSVLDARRKLTTARAIDVMVQVCAALTAAHEHDIVHRDVKPDNIVLVPAHDDEGHPIEIVKVCDFGMAALGTTTTERGTAVGTLEYMAPEQTTGLPVTPSADVYACGVVLYEMLVGEVPFTDDQAFRIMMKHRSELPVAPSSLDPSISLALEAVILRCMEKAPERRFQTARELRLELRKVSPSESKP